MNHQQDLPLWCKQTKSDMAYYGISVTALAARIKKSRGWTSNVLNGSATSETLMRDIDDAINHIKKDKTSTL